MGPPDDTDSSTTIPTVSSIPMVSTITAAGFALATNAWADDVAGEAIMHRYLSADERAALAERRPRARQQTLLGRIAAKDAVRHHLAKHLGLDVAPADIGIANDAAGRPVLTGDQAGDLRLSIAHTATIGVAMVADGTDVGIDIEPIEPRSPRFELLTLTDDEQRLSPVPGDDRDAWLTRLWAAKEAAAKATGRGLGGRPKDFRVGEVDGTRFLVNGRWILTDRYRASDLTGHLVAWTLVPRST